MEKNILLDDIDIPLTPLNNINIIKSDPKVVVGIDFGTSGVGYAYGFFNNRENIFESDFSGQSKSKKVPTEIILDTDLNDVLAFGAECKGYITGHDKNNYEYFKHIKMNLYKKNYIIKSTNDREANIELIITKILKEVSKKAIEQIHRKHDQNINREDIKWVVTIPAIWEEKSKKIMINASRSAGLINNNTDLSLFLALEPEVAGIYYNSANISFNAKNINEGKPYIICDIGGGTVDICTHRKTNISNNRAELIEEYPPIGGDYGGNLINEEFIKRLIVEIFGEEKINDIKKDESNEDWDKFEIEIEQLKKKFDEFEPTDFKLDCRLFEYDSDKTLEEYINDYNNKNLKFKYEIKKSQNKRNKWELLVPSKIFSDITKEISKKIFAHIEEIYNKIHTGFILFTGAGSQNYNISHFLYEFAKEKGMDITINTPEHPELSIVYGAVLFGFDNNVIRKRKARYTIGIMASRDWNEELYKDKGIKKKYELYDEYYCSNIFSKFITINEYINFDQVITKRYDAMVPNPSIIFYKTSRKNCTFIDEKDENDELIIEKFGEVTFNIGKDYDKNKNKVRMDMKLGGTYIDVSAVYLKTNYKLPITQTFV